MNVSVVWPVRPGDRRGGGGGRERGRGGQETQRGREGQKGDERGGKGRWETRGRKRRGEVENCITAHLMKYNAMIFTPCDGAIRVVQIEKYILDNRQQWLRMTYHESSVGSMRQSVHNYSFLFFPSFYLHWPKIKRNSVSTWMAWRVLPYCYYYLRVQNFAIWGFRWFCGY